MTSFYFLQHIHLHYMTLDVYFSTELKQFGKQLMSQ